ncbi:MAG TPA: carboxypeptidase regulatory-like domain-containing protein [Blastocatellia bacterium]|jgi:hypothetical protein
MSAHKNHRLSVLTALLVVWLQAGSAFSQTVTGTITGNVTDSSGAAISGAKITLVNEQTGSIRTLSANENGRFDFAAVQPGSYMVRIEQQGFQTIEKKNVVLSANETLALGAVELKAGQVTEVVTVTAQGERVETESSDLQARLTADQISLISTKGRDITSLLRLIPGTSNDDDIEAVGEGFGTNLPNISGQRGRSTVTTVDGLNASEPSGSNKISMTTNQDAIAEVKVLRNNYAAEYGNNGGAIINIVSKGGSRDYRGSAYYFVRNEAFNATPFFTNKAGLRKPLYRHNIWGFNFAGPIRIPKLFSNEGKDKAFFFFSLEKPHTITPTDPVFVTMPTELERRGDFSKSVDNTGKPVVITDPTTGKPFDGNNIPANRINKSGQALLNFFPLPNAPGGRTLAGAAYNYVNQKSVDVPKHSYLIRFDVRPTSKDSVYWKGQWWTSDNEGLGTSGWPGGDANRWGISSHYLYTDNGWSANWVHLVSRSIVNEFSFGMRIDTEGFIPSDGVIDKLTRSALNYTAPQLFSDNNHLDLIPRVTGWTSVAGTAANINWLDRWGEVGHDHIKPSFSDNLSIARGKHAYKFGTYFERLLNREAPGGNWSGTFNFGTSSSFTTSLGSTGYAYANALLGNFNSYSEQSGRPFTNNEIRVLQSYAQDEWRVNRRWTLNYGVRIGYHTPFFQLDNQGSNFDPARFDPAKAPLLYLPFCVGGNPATAACSTSNRRAMDPRNGQLLTNTNLVGTFVPGTGDLANGMVLASDPNAPRGFRMTRAVDFEPRVGMAWDIFGRGKTVLRMMGGVYHAPRVGGGTGGASSLGGNPPIQRSFTVNFGNIDNLTNLVGTALNSPSTVAAVEVNSHTPTTYNFTVGIQQDIGFKSVLEVSYVGSLTRHLGERRNINQVPDTAKWIDVHPENRNPFSAPTQNGPHLTGALADNFLRLYRGYGDINLTMWSGSTNYNALQVQLNRRYTAGFRFGVAYTYSKSFDYANDDSSDVNNGRPYKAFNYGPADFDQTHIFAVNYIYDIPNLSRHLDNRLVRALFDHWQVSGITTYASGKPKTFGSGTGLNWTYGGTVGATNITDFTGGDINARPVFVCNPNRKPGTFSPDGSPYLIDTSCFAKPGAAGNIGNLQRNLIRLPSTFNTDLAFFKNIPLGEKRTFQFRWETYNLFNRANFTDLNGAMTFDANGVQTSTTFGTARASRTARVMQASLRINF